MPRRSRPQGPERENMRTTIQMEYVREMDTLRQNGVEILPRRATRSDEITSSTAWPRNPVPDVDPSFYDD
jgi:hypothetical protein